MRAIFTEAQEPYLSLCATSTELIWKIVDIGKFINFRIIDIYPNY